ncbi:MAG: hypothetical protein LBF58_06150, partial [Deltaproteobacteria bacterium]|nr:hypothetical protein [Deltaproteobacteria bacterium]
TSVSVSFDAGEIVGLSGLVTLGAGGVFNAPALKALVATGPIGVSVGAMGLTSNEVAFGVDYNQAGLSLSASRGTLEYLNPVSVDFTVKYLGQPLLAGTQVSVTFEAGEIAGLPATVVLGNGGVFNASEVKSLVITGPINVSVGALGLSSNDVGFGVTLDQAGLSLSASRATIPYLSPVSVDFTVKYLGQPLPAGTQVSVMFFAGELSGMPPSVVLGAGGTFNAPALRALVVSGPIGVEVGVFGLTSNEVGFGVSLGGGNLSLTASRGSLEFLAPTEVLFTVSFMGSALPAGTTVGFDFDAGGLAGLPKTAVLGPGGEFVATGLTARVLAGPVGVSATLGGLSSNEVRFGVYADGGSFGLSARPGSLEAFVPTGTAFGFSYKGVALPAGIPVGLAADAGLLENLAASGVTDGAGEVTVPNLTAATIDGPIEVRGTVAGSPAGKVDLGVTLVSGGLGLGFSVEPDVSWQFPHLPPENGPYLKSCQTFNVTLFASYRGRVLPNADVYVDGFGLSPSGLAKTDGDGKIAATISFLKTDEAEYRARGNVYDLTVKGVTRSFLGPEAVSFVECGI